MFTSLMSTRRFAPLFLCQFFAAFGDNFLKTALGFLIVYQLTEDNSPALTQLAAATFIGPYFFLSGGDKEKVEQAETEVENEEESVATTMHNITCTV